MHVIPISVPQVDLGKFLELAKEALGYDSGRPGDTRKLSDYARFLSGISCFHHYENTKRPVAEILRESASLCAHLFFTFAVIGHKDVIFKSMERSRLKHTIADGLKGNQVALVSGSLQEWKEASLECCTQEADPDLRLMYDKIILFFEHHGLKEIWHDTRKRSHQDGSFYLEQR